MTKNAKYKNQIKLIKMKKGYLILCGLILIATLLIVSFSLELAASSAHDGADMYPAPPSEVAASGTQFNLNIAYAYVGSAPSNVTSYLDKTSNASMYLISEYPSVVRLNVTRVPGVQIACCDAELEVYGVKIAANTGTTEYHAYFIGTNYNFCFSKSNESTLVPYVNNLVDHNVYSEITGGFVFNWTANTSVLSHTIGSIGGYTSKPSGWAGLWSSGKPNDISVTVYRIGYITMSNGSVSVYKDSITNNGTDLVQIGNYRDGFLYNKLVPAERLQQIDIFHPIH